MHARRFLFLLVPLLLGCGDAERPAPSQPAAEAVAAGTFVAKGGQSTVGSYRIERSAGDLRLVLADDFRTDEGPDLHVALSPTTVADAANENALAEGAVVVAPLAGRDGPQTYDLPDDLDLQPFRSVVIHCVAFTHLYGAAPLE